MYEKSENTAPVPFDADPDVDLDNLTPEVGDTITALLVGEEKGATYSWGRVSGELLIPVGNQKTYVVLPDDAMCSLQLTVTLATGKVIKSKQTAPVCPNLEFQWFRHKEGSGIIKPIEGADSFLYVVTGADCGYELMVMATMPNAISLFSEVTNAVPADLVLNEMFPTVGQTISGDIYPADLEAGASFKWSRKNSEGETDITGANAASYEADVDDVGYELWLTATLTNGAVLKAYTKPVIDTTSGVIIVDNETPKVGEAINATVLPSDPDAKFQWFRYFGEASLTPIPGATKAQYVATAEDAGSQLFVTAQLKNGMRVMSRKGNCYDNSIMENFFGVMKQEMYYGYVYYSYKELKDAIEKYIDYYNNQRIKQKLSWMSPVEYRLSQVA